MSKALGVLPEAEAEIRAAMLWYESRRAGLGAEFVGVIEHVFDRISGSPHEFASWDGEPRYRRAVVDRFPFIVVFEERADAIEVVAVAHGKRRPGYWSRRSAR